MITASICHTEILSRRGTMSFSSEVKEGIAKHIPGSRHCQIAELATILSYCGSIRKNEQGTEELVITMDKVPLFRKCFTLLKKTYNINNAFACSTEEDYEINGRYEIVISGKDEVWDILCGTGIVGKDGVLRGFRRPVEPMLIKNSCCRSAYLGAAFLCAGSMSNPEKGYHLEIVCDGEEQAKQITEIMSTFEIEAKYICRKKYFVVYIKEGSAISEFLGICGAHVSLMDFENHRILKEMGNTINRRVNCETANLAKTVAASTRQTEDILLIQDVYGFENLPDNLREIAEIRLEYPEASLQELGELLDPPVGKSGVNHRLRKLGAIASELR